MMEANEQSLVRPPHLSALPSTLIHFQVFKFLKPEGSIAVTMVST